MICNSFLPENNGTAIRSAYLARGLLKLNQELYIGTINNNKLQSVKYEGIFIEQKNLDEISVKRYDSQFQLTIGLIILHLKIKFDIIHARGPRYGLIAWMLHKIFGTPYIIEINSFLPQNNRIKKILLSRIIKSSTRLIVLSDYAAIWFNQTFGVPENKIDVIKNGVDISSFEISTNEMIKNDLGISDEVVVVGYAGTFYKWQGVFDFVKVAKLIVSQRKDVKFLMVGDGPDYRKIKSMIKEYGLSDFFILTGNVPFQSVKLYLDAVDIVLLARTPDLLNQLSIPLKILEAMVMKKVVVVTPVNGLKEVINHKKTGIIAGPNLESLSTAILEIIENTELRISVGESARKEVITNYQWDLQGGLLLNSYGKAVSNKNEKGLTE